MLRTPQDSDGAQGVGLRRPRDQRKPRPHRRHRPPPSARRRDSGQRRFLGSARRRPRRRRQVRVLPGPEQSEAENGRRLRRHGEEHVGRDELVAARRRDDAVADTPAPLAAVDGEDCVEGEHVVAGMVGLFENVEGLVHPVAGKGPKKWNVDASSVDLLELGVVCGCHGAAPDGVGRSRWKVRTAEVEEATDPAAGFRVGREVLQNYLTHR